MLTVDCLNVDVLQAQLVYMAYNDYDMAERLLSHALLMEPQHLLARMHLDLVHSLRRAAALVPYQPFVSNPPYAQASSAPMPDGEWDQVVIRVCPSSIAAEQVFLVLHTRRATPTHVLLSWLRH